MEYIYNLNKVEVHTNLIVKLIKDINKIEKCSGNIKHEDVKDFICILALIGFFPLAIITHNFVGLYFQYISIPMFMISGLLLWEDIYVSSNLKKIGKDFGVWFKKRKSRKLLMSNLSLIKNNTFISRVQGLKECSDESIISEILYNEFIGNKDTDFKIAENIFNHFGKENERYVNLYGQILKHLVRYLSDSDFLIHKDNIIGLAINLSDYNLKIELTNLIKNRIMKIDCDKNNKVNADVELNKLLSKKIDKIKNRKTVIKIL